MLFRCRGFSILEILAVVAILAILMALSFPAIQKARPWFERAACMNNLKNLHAAFAGYAAEGWPQMPKGIAPGSLSEQRWWLEKSQKDLGLTKKTWQCPTISRMFAGAPENDRPVIHYLPTLFSKQPGRALKNSQMPWFIEIGNAHGRGNLMIRANGTVEAGSN